MLLEGLDDDVVSLFRVAHRGIEELLLDLRVDLELGLQFGKELLPVALSLFELGENLLHLAVVGLQQRDRIHIRRLVVEEQQPDDQQDKQKRPDSEVRSVAVHSNLHNSDMSNTDIDTIRLGARSATTRTGKESAVNRPDGRPETGCAASRCRRRSDGCSGRYRSGVPRPGPGSTRPERAEDRAAG